jgi:p-aminobenzoyl-glutamate transporter AbgT
MEQPQTPTTPYRSTAPSDAWAGWVTFAAVILALLGTLNVIQGFLALFDDGYFAVRTEEQLLLVEFTAWGVILLIWGALLILAGLALAAGKGWARWFALAAVFVNVIAQIGFLPAYPLWSAIMIGLDVVVIFALTARWDEARAAM